MVEKVKDVLEVDVSQEVKQVIDVEQREEDEVQKEIANYIVTNQLARNFQTLFNAVEQELEETGVWLSGFYGSGKSYFAKVFGYLLKNPTIGGTSSHERFSHRLEGLKEKEWLLQNLGMVRNKDFEVVMLDLTKQGQGTKGLPWILYENFLTELGFMDSKYGLVEFDLYLNNDYGRFVEAVKRETDKDWEDLKLSRGLSYSAMRQALENEFPDSYGNDVDRLYDDVEDAMNDFGADDLKQELQRYFDKFPDKQLFFIVDEVSQSITDELIDLSDLEGVQESLSAVGASKVWLVATAQEKLEDVLSREGISKNEVSKISDRFKTSIHISGKEVNKVIQERLLKKNLEGREALRSFYDQHSGEISELTNLQNCDKPSTTTDSKEDFINYYPFHPYQLELLKDFLYKVHQKVTGSQTPRGMIIVLHRILKRLADDKLYRLATAYELGEEGEKFPSTALKQRFNQAEEQVSGTGEVNGRHVMEATYFLTETGQVTPEVEDIAKACLTRSGCYYNLKSNYADVVKKLQDKNLLIKKEGYSIATELEEKLISEMKQEEVGLSMRKRILMEEVKETGLFEGFQSVELDGQHYPVKVTNYAGDLFAGRSKAELKLQIADLYKVSKVSQEDFQEAIEEMKYEFHNEEGSILIVPQTRDFRVIDELAKKIYRYRIIEKRYGNDSDDEIREIARDMQDDRRDKEEILRQKLKSAFRRGVLIRDFEEYELKEGNFQPIRDQLQTLAENLYTKRLSHHLNESLSRRILEEENPERLSDYFDADEFRFFDEGGNFTGEGLPTVDEIARRTSQIEVDGKALEEEFTSPPYGWDYDDIVVTLAVLLRAGQLKVKYQGEEILDHRHPGVNKVFTNARNFRKAQFKVTQVKLKSTQKRSLVDSIKEIDRGQYSDSDLGYSSADIHVVKQIPQLAKGYLNDAEFLERTLGKFSKEIPELTVIKSQLRPYKKRTVNEDTYKDIASEFLEDSDQIETNINLLRKLRSFQEKNLEDLRCYRSFMKDLEVQLSQVEDEKLQTSLKSKLEEFNRFNKDPLESFSHLQSLFQKAKDIYYQAAYKSHTEMTKGYENLKDKLQGILDKAQSKGGEANRDLIHDLESAIEDSKNYICNELSIHETIKCNNCQHDLRMMKLALENLSNKEDKLFNFRDRIEIMDSEENGDKTREAAKHRVNIPHGSMTVSAYRSFLKEQLNKTNTMQPIDRIEIHLED